MNSIYLIDNGLREEADDFLEYAQALGVRPTRFHSNEAFLDFWSILSQAEPHKPNILYPDYADWIGLAHAVIHLHPHRKGYQTGLSDGHLHRVTTSYHIMGRPVSPERVSDLLYSLLGPGLNGESLRYQHNERFKHNFCSYLSDLYEEWDKKREGPAVYDDLVYEMGSSAATREGLKLFFDHCPFCMERTIQVKYWKSPPETWRNLAGRAGYFVICRSCDDQLLFKMTAMSLVCFSRWDQLEICF